MTIRDKTLSSVIIVTLIVLLGAPVLQASTTTSLSINHHVFTIEVPRTIEEYDRGLMYQRHLDASHGMIFLIEPSQAREAAMWMKNTFIPLDMLFIGPDYRIACVIENTKPLSLKNIKCDKPVMAVIELNAGEAKQFHLTKGATIEKNE